MLTDKIFSVWQKKDWENATLLSAIVGRNLSTLN